VAKRIAEAMGGRLSVTSELGVGEYFYSALTGLVEVGSRNGIGCSGIGIRRTEMNENILLVEDEQALRTALEVAFALKATLLILPRMAKRTAEGN